MIIEPLQPWSKAGESGGWAVKSDAEEQQEELDAEGRRV